MKRSITGAPEPFALAPLLALLPVEGKLGKLESLTSSLYARYEKSQSVLRELGRGTNSAERQRYAAEEAMLKQVLDWLALTPEDKA